MAKGATERLLTQPCIAEVFGIGCGLSHIDGQELPAVVPLPSVRSGRVDRQPVVNVPVGATTVLSNAFADIRFHVQLWVLENCLT
jgi:hypothetical protein